MEELIGQAARYTALELTENERADLLRLGRQAAANGLVRINAHDLQEATRQIGSDDDVIPVALSHDIVHSQDFAALRAEAARVAASGGPQADIFNQSDALRLIQRGASVEEAAREAGVTREDGSIHPQNRARLRAEAARVVRAGPPATTAERLRALRLIQRGASVEEAAREAGVTREDGSIHPQDRARLRAEAARFHTTSV